MAEEEAKVDDMATGSQSTEEAAAVVEVPIGCLWESGRRVRVKPRGRGVEEATAKAGDWYETTGQSTRLPQGPPVQPGRDISATPMACPLPACSAGCRPVFSKSRHIRKNELSEKRILDFTTILGETSFCCSYTSCELDRFRGTTRQSRSSCLAPRNQTFFPRDPDFCQKKCLHLA